MKKTVIKNPRVNEEYQVIKHPSGLTICLYPMPGFASAYALFASKYGSVDVKFKTKDDADFVCVPEGIAHYLEHKLFENDASGEDSNDAFQLFAKTGANPNAFTSFDKTAYLFSCSQKFEENLEILLNFVQEPYFTDESVEKERGIISQEIKMYEDEPGWRVFFNGLQALYHSNPVRIDIGGTIESIAKIDKDLLYRCYKTFYNLNNMVLSIAGNFDVEKTLEICDRLLKPTPDLGLEAVFPDEPREVKQREIVQKLTCSMPLFNIFFKSPSFTGRELVRRSIICNIILETVLGKTSAFYDRLLNEGLINNCFSVGVLDGRGFFTLTADGESSDPRKVFEEIKAALKSAKQSGLARDEFENVRKKTYGETIGMLGIPSAAATAMMDAHFHGYDFFDAIEITAGLTFDEVVEILAEIDEDNSCISIIEPTGD
ncbi:MAG: insulinase family protein [Oscillospiraceae bacterium]|nr:insulinase family protein [Oscillospiraceae bacterium]